jgi:hypothetical protein
MPLMELLMEAEASISPQNWPPELYHDCAELNDPGLVGACVTQEMLLGAVSPGVGTCC